MATNSDEINSVKFKLNEVMKRYIEELSPLTPFTPINGRTIVGERKSQAQLTLEFELYKLKSELSEIDRKLADHEKLVLRRAEVVAILNEKIPIYHAYVEEKKVDQVPFHQHLLRAPSPQSTPFNARPSTVLLDGFPQAVERIEKFVRRSIAQLPEAPAQSSTTADFNFEDYSMIANQLEELAAQGIDPFADSSDDQDIGNAEGAANVHGNSTSAGAAAEANDGHEEGQQEEKGSNLEEIDVIVVSDTDEDHEDDEDEVETKSMEDHEDDEDEVETKSMESKKANVFGKKYAEVAKILLGEKELNFHSSRVKKVSRGSFLCIDCPDRKPLFTCPMLEHRSSVHSNSEYIIPATKNQLAHLCANNLNRTSNGKKIYYCPEKGCGFECEVSPAIDRVAAVSLLLSHLTKKLKEKKGAKDKILMLLNAYKAKKDEELELE